MTDYPDTYNLVLMGTLTNYGISYSRPFKVVVTDCVASIDISNISLPYLENMWYSSPESYDITGISAGIVQTPNCYYSYVYTAYWLPNGYTSPIKLPANEITF